MYGRVGAVLAVLVSAAGLGRAELPAAWPIRGITFTGERYCPNSTGSLGGPESDHSLGHLRSTGANWVSVVVTEYQDRVDSTQIRPIHTRRNDTERPAYYVFITAGEDQLRRTIRQARGRGLQVMLKPHVDLLYDKHPAGRYWRGDIGCFPGFTDAEWDGWFESYTTMLLKYATIGEQEGARMLSVNTELYCANRQTDRWRRVVAAVRRVFSGQLTEAAMPQGCTGSAQFANGSTIGGHGQCAGIPAGQLPGGCVDGVGWWDALDIIGVDAYFVFNGTNLPDIVSQWRPYVTWLAQLAARHNKPVVFTEVGYCSGMCSRQHNATAADYELQRLRYQALFEAMRGQEAWFRGAFWWNWNSDDGDNPHDDFLSPQWKPAEGVLRQYYRAGLPQPAVPVRASACMGYGKGTC